ncbi:MAG: hypothetical protein JSU83_07570 [Deltaproteobacteria bacterium]|nr:MAG: hypothetical protein JSU83_07570 [Deltaproteobacteria bacterium]
MSGIKPGHRYALIFALVSLGLIFTQGPFFAYAQNEDVKEKRPQRLIVMAAEYPGVEVGVDEDVRMDLIFHNRGRTDENVDVWIAEKPDGWKAKIKTYRYVVTGAHIPSGDDKTLSFEAEPDNVVQPGKYKFRVEAQTQDGRFKMNQNISVTVKEKEEDTKKEKGVKLTTSYPVLQGPSDAKFEFSVEVDSKLDEDAVFDLFAQGPQGWETNFKPAYEQKYISSVRLKANQSQTIALEVKPQFMATAGEYPVNIRVSSSDAKAEAQFTVILTGTYDMEVGTPDGLLSMNARQGKPANVSFYVKNIGSAALNDIEFLSFKPENWKVELKPEKIPAIEPGDLKQVEAIITPYEEALVGDYSVTFKIDGQKVSKGMEYRVTVKASSAWGWIGIGIIVFVIAGLTGLFRWLGRR